MEKIQAALAKARATRSGDRSGESVAPPVRAGATPGPVPGMPGSTAAVLAGAIALPSASFPAPETGRDEEAITAAWAALPSFAVQARRLERAHVVTFAGGADAVSFDALRTRLLQQMRSHGWRRVAITSPGAGCGKTTLSLNLAFSLARQPEVRTLLAELDLRRPSIARVLGTPDRANLGAVLAGEAAFDACGLRLSQNLMLAGNQGPARDAAELLASAGAAQTLARIEETYAPDITIFDMPPMLVTDDMMAFAGEVDCVLLVAAAEASTIKEVDTCERELAAQTNVLGVVLNKCRYTERGAGYGYYD
jgi:protein-tyrosine kinase